MTLSHAKYHEKWCQVYNEDFDDGLNVVKGAP